MDEDCRKRGCGFKGVGIWILRLWPWLWLRGDGKHSLASLRLLSKAPYAHVALCWVGDKSQLKADCKSLLILVPEARDSDRG